MARFDESSEREASFSGAAGSDEHICLIEQACAQRRPPARRQPPVLVDWFASPSAPRAARSNGTARAGTDERACARCTGRPPTAATAGLPRLISNAGWWSAPLRAFRRNSAQGQMHDSALHPHAVALLGAALWELAKLAWDYTRLIQRASGTTVQPVTRRAPARPVAAILTSCATAPPPPPPRGGGAPLRGSVGRSPGGGGGCGFLFWFLQ